MTDTAAIGTETDDYNETWSSVARRRSDHYRAMCAAYDKNPTGDTLTIEIHARQLADILPHVLDELDRCKALDLADATVATERGVVSRMTNGATAFHVVHDDRDEAVGDYLARREWFESLNEPTKVSTGIDHIELCSRTVARWPDGGRYIGPWIANETETP